MAAGGGDPTDIVEKIAKVIDMKKKGTQIEDAVLEVFAKKAEAEPTGPEEPEAPMPPEAPQSPPEAGTAPAGPQGPPPDASAILAQLAGQG
jgi:hypothetical protein